MHADWLKSHLQVENQRRLLEEYEKRERARQVGVCSPCHCMPTAQPNTPLLRGAPHGSRRPTRPSALARARGRALSAGPARLDAGARAASGGAGAFGARGAARRRAVRRPRGRRGAEGHRGPRLRAALRRGRGRRAAWGRWAREAGGWRGRG